MKCNILKFICGIGLVCSLWSCKSGDQTFPDYQGGTTVYFPYQYPVRTIVLGDDEYDLTNDHNHQCQILATFGGSYNGSNGSVQVAVDESLCNNLFFEDGVTPVKAMPSSYYTLSTTNLNFNGTFNGATTVQLTDAFFNDPDAVKNTYVIPLVMIGQTGFGQILTGEVMEGFNEVRTDASVWNVKPMDYVLYCVKFQNKFSGWWLTNGTTSTDNIEKARAYEIKTKTLNSCVYTVSCQRKYQAKTDKGPEWQERIYTCDLLLTFDANDKCVISSLTDGLTATGTGSWGDDIMKKAWGDRDRDGLELNYSIPDFGTDDYGNVVEGLSVNEKLVWQRSGVTTEEFTPVYVQ